MRRREAAQAQLLGEELLDVGLLARADDDHRVGLAQGRDGVGSEQGTGVLVGERHGAGDVAGRHLGRGAGVEDAHAGERRAEHLGGLRVDPVEVGTLGRRDAALAPPRNPAGGHEIRHRADHEHRGEDHRRLAENPALHGAKG